jgi:hypothetical protein
MPRTVEDAISDAIARGALTAGRAEHYRALARTRPDVADWVDRLQGNPVHAAAGRQQGRTFATVAAAPAGPPGADPALYAANPLLYEMRRDRPALVQAAMAEDPNPPRLFGDRDLPPFTASGLDPAMLASLPWPVRREVAEAPTLAAAYQLAERYGSGSDADLPGLLELRDSRYNLPYVEAMSQWLAGSGADAPPAGDSGQPRHPGTGQYLPAAAAPLRDYTTEALHAELFGNHAYEPPSLAVAEPIKTTKGG